MIDGATADTGRVHPILLKSDEELAAGPSAAASPVISLDDVRRHVSLEPEYAFLVTSDNPLLMGCLGWIATFPDLLAVPSQQIVWDILEGVLNKQVQTLSNA